MQHDPILPIAILAAMPEEMAQFTRLLDRAGVGREAVETHGPRTYDRAILRGVPLVLLTTGMGMVAAAAATEGAIAQYAPRAVLNFGCAGAHRDDLMPGDVVVGTACIAYDHGHLLPGGAFDPKPARLFAGGEHRKLDTLPVSEPLLAVAEYVAGLRTWEAEPWPAALWPDNAPHRPPRVHFGPVASSDRFTQDADALRALHDRHASLCEDMEAAATAQVCALHDVPFFTAKDLSNNEFHATSTDATWDALTGEIGKRAAAFTFALLQKAMSSVQ